MNEAIRRPDIEITRKLKNGWIRSYGHLYWKPFLLAIHLFGRTFLIKDNKFRIFPIPYKERTTKMKQIKPTKCIKCKLIFPEHWGLEKHTCTDKGKGKKVRGF